MYDDIANTALQLNSAPAAEDIYEELPGKTMGLLPGFHGDVCRRWMLTVTLPPPALYQPGSCRSVQLVP